MKVGHKLIQGGNVPGGHRVPWDGVRKPFITPMTECNSVPLRYSDVVVDIGAYVGTYAIRCARFPVKQVIAYEPTPQTFGILALTRLPNLQLVNAAVVGDDRKEAELFLSAGVGVTNSIVMSRRKEGVVTVPAVRYEDAVAGASIVKIDVEGAEYGFERLVQPQLRAIIIDFHEVAGKPWRQKAEAMIDQIRAAGFSPVIEPTFSCGWTCAGSWMRELETSGEFEPMMRGRLCCGCATPISADRRALCHSCFGLWSKKHRTGYALAEAARA